MHLPIELREYMKNYVQQYVSSRRVMDHWLHVYDLEAHRLRPTPDEGES